MRFLVYLYFVYSILPVQAHDGLRYYQVNTAPHRAHVLAVDLKAYDMKIIPAWMTMLGLSSVPEIANRVGAVAGINGSFYHKNAAYTGTLASACKTENIWQSMAPKMRGAVGWTGSDVGFDRLKTTVDISFLGEKIPVLLNVYAPKKIILYTPEFHAYTLTDFARTEVVVRDNVVVQVMSHGNNKIPEDGVILSFPKGVPVMLSKGDMVAVDFHVSSELDARDINKWKAYHNILGGALLLMKNGVVIKDFSSEKTLKTFITKRHARSAVCRTKDNHILLVAVDHDYGHARALTFKDIYTKLRQSGMLPDDIAEMALKDVQVFVDSLTAERVEGFSIPELATFMAQQGCEDALNLDGGNSTTLYFDGQVVNTPSEGKSLDQLPLVANALVVTPKKHQTG